MFIILGDALGEKKQGLVSGYRIGRAQERTTKAYLVVVVFRFCVIRNDTLTLLADFIMKATKADRV